MPPRLSAWKIGVGVGELGRDPREAPVHHEHFAVVAEHHVFRLQIAMDHAAGVGEGHRVGHAQQDAQVLVELLLVDHLVPGRAVDALHRVEQRACVVRAEVVDRHDVRVVELAGDDRFGDELVALLLADLGRGLEHLHGDGAGDRRLMGRVDHAHAALADDVQQLVVGHFGERLRAAAPSVLRFSRMYRDFTGSDERKPVIVSFCRIVWPWRLPGVSVLPHSDSSRLRSSGGSDARSSVRSLSMGCVRRGDGF